MKRHILVVAALLAFSFALAGPTATAAGDEPGRRAAPDWVDPASGLVPPDVIVYYFHNLVRCQTCLAMEAEAATVVRDDYPDELESGVVAWRVLCIQNPENEPLVRKYGLDGPALILSEWADGKERRWRDLDRIWELIDTPDAYRKYVRSAIASRLSDDDSPDEER